MLNKITQKLEKQNITAIFAPVDLKTYLIKNQNYLSIAAIEQATKIPNTILHKWLRGKAHLKTEYQERLKQWLEGMNFKS